MAQHQQPAALHFWQQSLVFLAACAIVISRRPDAIYHAQFWAEDGHVWFADAYNYGWWAALFRTQDGYFQTLPRLAASFALVVPLSVAPLVLNLVAAALQALPVNLLLSSRSSSWGSLRDRAILAGIYLALPNCAEVSCGITESQWLLALSAFLMVAGTPPRNIKGRTFDFIILLLFGLTGPFCIFLLPVSVYLAIQRHEGWRWVLTGALVALSLVQAWGLLIMDTSGRPRVVLGDSVVMFVRIIGSQIYLGILLGSDKIGAFPGTGIFILQLCSTIVGSAIVAICFIKSSVEVKLFICFSAALLAASLVASAGYLPAASSRWQQLASAGGVRYWFFPSLVFAWSLSWCLRSRIITCKIVAGYLLLIMCFGIVRDWRHPVLKDMHFAEATNRFKTAPEGTAITIPLNPEGWNMRLIKHEPTN